MYLLDTRAATSHFPGIGRYVRNLARCLPALLTPDESLTILHDTTYPPIWLHEDHLRRMSSAATPFSLAQQWQVPHLIRQSGAALYHSPYYLMPYRPGAPTLLPVYDIISLRYPQAVSPQARLFFRLASILALRAATRVAAISESARQDFITIFGVPAEKICAIPLAAEAQFTPQNQAAITRVREKFDLPEPFALYLGINKPHKNLTRLVRVWQKIKATGWRLAIGGAWDVRYPQARELAAEAESISFLGPIAEEDLPALYAAAALFVFPSLYEGFGLPVLEAMACGTAVACANTSSLPEVGGEAALYFDPLNEDEICDVLLRAISDANLRQELSERGLRQAALFSWQHCASLTLGVYRAIKSG